MCRRGPESIEARNSPLYAEKAAFTDELHSVGGSRSMRKKRGAEARARSLLFFSFPATAARGTRHKSNRKQLRNRSRASSSVVSSCNFPRMDLRSCVSHNRSGATVLMFYIYIAICGDGEKKNGFVFYGIRLLRWIF